MAIEYKTNDLFQTLGGTLSPYSCAIQGILSTGILAGIIQLVEFASFKCKCIEDKSLNQTNCSTQTQVCASQNHNSTNGYLFIFAPAAFLFIFGFIANKEFYRKITGCRNRNSGVEFKWKNILNPLGSSTVVFVAWIVLSLIDGDYLASSVTPFPYKFATGQTCKTPMVRLIKKFHLFSNTFLISGELPESLKSLHVYYFVLIKKIFIRSC